MSKSVLVGTRTPQRRIQLSASLSRKISGILMALTFIVAALAYNLSTLKKYCCDLTIRLTCLTADVGAAYLGEMNGKKKTDR
jgi:hypothetical protein